MKLFTCTNCGQPVYFENSFCLNCNSSLGFEAGMLQIFALQPQPDGTFSLTGHSGNKAYRYCNNFTHSVCNWLVPANEGSGFCAACDPNRLIPDLSNTDHAQRWGKIEIAKHRLVYQLLKLKLPFVSKGVDPAGGVAFDFMSEAYTGGRVMTGHDNGVITLNIAEADDIEREMARKSMDEVYRSLLGHFRHEIGHYYFDRLIMNTPRLQEFRQLFGDESANYGQALETYYNNGPLANWSQQYISAYATAHPWEDWAETWAHYLHIIDTLETAYAFGLSVDPLVAEKDENLSAEILADPYRVRNFDSIVKMWLPLTFALNSLNRSMGLPDLYPFYMNQPVIDKMKFIHETIRQAARQASSAALIETVEN